MLPVLDLRAAEWHRVQGDCYLIFHIYYYTVNINEHKIAEQWNKLLKIYEIFIIRNKRHKS
jgi:hypothetical protein